MTGQQLKNSILQEAIEGRLVPQDPNDEPASVLLERIRAEKARLVKEKKIKKDKNESRIYRTEDGHWMEHFEDKNREDVCIDEEIPFDIPKGWEWCRMRTTISLLSGRDLEPHQYNANHIGIPYMTGASNFNNGELIINRWTSQPVTISTKNDLLITCKGTIGEMAFNQIGDIHIARQIMAISPYIINSKYVKILLSRMIGVFNKDANSIIPGISRDNILYTLLPLPSLAEQRRIVEKIESLLPKVEAYGKAQEELEKLNEALPEQLKRSILQEAIEGRLVPQDPNNEPASVLLERIRAEKARLVKEKKIKKDKNESRIYRTEDGHWMEHFEDKNREDVCIDEEIPFDVPKGWEWCRLGNITYNHGQKKPDVEFSYIDIGSINNKQQKLNENENIIQAKDAPSRARKIVFEGDILYATVRPYLHNMCIIDKKFSKEPIASTGFAVLCCFIGIYNKFLFNYLLSPMFDSYANDGDNAKGMAYPAINDEKLYKGLIPVPPLAEQHRIVEKLEEILPKLNNLKKETEK